MDLKNDDQAVEELSSPDVQSFAGAKVFRENDWLRPRRLLLLMFQKRFEEIARVRLFC